MPKFSANIDFLFKELPLLDRLAAAKKAGFRAVEMPWPYVADLSEFAAAREAADIAVVEFNIPTGDLLAGGYGLAGVPGRQNAFKEAVEEAREWALRLECRQLNVLAGFQVPWASRAAVIDVFVENLIYAADRFADDGISMLVEACNRRERPGYLIATTDEAMEVISMAQRPNIYLEHDIYHLQISEGDLADRMKKTFDFIGHIQFADTPGRHEPGTGEINYPFIFSLIDSLGFKGWCGAEYVPTTARTQDGLSWMEPYLDSQE